MLNLLRTEKFVNADTLAQSLSCSKRTIFRDLRLLNSSGIKISFDETCGGYVLEDGPQLPAHGLADDELLSLLLASRMSPLSKVPHFSDLSQRAQNFLLEHGGPALKKQFERYLGALEFEGLPLKRGEGQRLRMLIKTTAQEGTVEITYAPPSEEPRTFQFQPHRVVHSSNGWTVIGHSVADQRETELRVCDISDCRDFGDSFDKAPGPSTGESSGADGKVIRSEAEHEAPKPHWPAQSSPIKPTENPDQPR